MNVRPDPTFHATAKLAMEAPVEGYAYTLMLSPDFSVLTPTVVLIAMRFWSGAISSVRA